MTIEELKKERDSLSSQFEDLKGKTNQIWGALSWINQRIAAMEKEEKPNG